MITRLSFIKNAIWILPIALLAGWMAFGQALFLTDSAFVGSLNKPAASGGGTAPDNTLILHYKFNEGSGTAINDETGNNDGTNNATWITGKSGSGYALQFDGVNDFATSTQQASGVITYSTNTISVSFWLYWDSFANDDDIACETSPNSNTTYPAYYFDPNHSGGSFEVALRDNTGYRQERFTRPSAAAWHHYVFVLDRRTATHDFIVYVDGSVVSTTTGLTSSTGTDSHATAKLYLMSRGGTSIFGAGRMDDFRIYKGVLDLDEVTYLYNNPE